MPGGLDDLRRRIGWWLPALLLLGCTAPALDALVVLGRVLASRIDYPMDIEWMEGGALLHAHRLLHGLPIYGPPSQGFLPYPYPPGHYVGLAALSLFQPLDYALGRSLSIGSLALATAALVHELMLHYRRTDEALTASLLSLGLVAIGFPVVGGWYDIIRNDTMALGLAVLAAALLGDGRVSYRRLTLTALVLTAAVYTKQTNAIFAVWLCLFELLRSFRRGAWLAFITGLSCGVLLFYLQRTSDGWFWTYTITNISRHPVFPMRALDGFLLLVAYAPYVCAMPLVLLIWRRSLRARTVKWAGMFVWSIPASLLPFIKAGGYLNNLVPMIVLAGPITLIVFADVLAWLRRIRPVPRIPRSFAFGVALTTFAAAGWFIAARPILFDRFHLSRAQYEAALKLNAIIGKLEGGVLIPDHPFLAIRNGHTTPQFHEMSYQDATVAGMKGVDLQGFLSRTHARWAILSGGEAPLTVGWFHLIYERVTGLDVYVGTLTGFYSSPRILMKLREPIMRRDVVMLFDFEEGLGEWQTEGNAFTIVGRPGSHQLSSFNAPLGDDARGVALSPPFVIDRDKLELWIGGGAGTFTRVELIVGERVAHLTSAFNTDMLTPIIWDVRALRHQEVRIRVIDQATGFLGHITIGLVRLFDVAT